MCSKVAKCVIKLSCRAWRQLAKPGVYGGQDCCLYYDPFERVSVRRERERERGLSVNSLFELTKGQTDIDTAASLDKEVEKKDAVAVTMTPRLRLSARISRQGMKFFKKSRCP